jgi:hypothetical protein
MTPCPPVAPLPRVCVRPPATPSSPICRLGALPGSRDRAGREGDNVTRPLFRDERLPPFRVAVGFLISVELPRGLPLFGRAKEEDAFTWFFLVLLLSK